MTKDDIISLPHKSLRAKSQRVGFITPEVLKVVKDMEDATIDWEANRNHEVGVALAAVQINQLLRIIVIRNNYDDKEDHSFTTFINPEVTKLEGSIVEDYEGCLSIKDIYGKVPRYEKVKVKALDTNGKVFRVTADGFLARILQHEIDHTSGTVFIDHIRNNPESFYRLLTDGNLEQIDFAKDIENNSELWG